MKYWVGLAVMLLFFFDAPVGFAAPLLAPSLTRTIAHFEGDEKPKIDWAFTDTGSLPATARKRLFSEDQYMYHMLVDGLSGYQHAIFYGNVVRIEHELKKGPRTCYPASSNADERRKFTYLTRLYVSPSLELVLKKDLAEKLKDRRGFISLSKLIKIKDLHPALAEARSYGPIIDKIMASENPPVQRPLQEPFAANIVDIIHHGRVDYSIEYDFIINELIKANSENSDVTTVPIAEVPAFNTQYLACSKTPEGLKIITEADKIIRAHVKDQEYKASLLSLAGNPHNIPYQKAVAEFLKDRALKPEIIE